MQRSRAPTNQRGELWMPVLVTVLEPLENARVDQDRVHQALGTREMLRIVTDDLLPQECTLEAGEHVSETEQQKDSRLLDCCFRSWFS